LKTAKKIQHGKFKGTRPASLNPVCIKVKKDKQEENNSFIKATIAVPKVSENRPISCNPYEYR
jgi:hypothetical protein